MKHEQKAVAALLVFYCGRSALAYSIGRDPDCAVSNVSPGLAVLVRSIQDAIQDGLQYYDFLRGDERFKLHLTKSSRKTVTLLVGRSASARFYLQALRLKDLIKQHYPGRSAGAAQKADQRPVAERTEEGHGAPVGARPDTETHAIH
jgi:CelD/BcsL family acetyltransferase involved in cellulose biosynthesis